MPAHQHARVGQEMGERFPLPQDARAQTQKCHSLHVCFMTLHLLYTYQLDYTFIS